LNITIEKAVQSEVNPVTGRVGDFTMVKIECDETSVDNAILILEKFKK